MTPFTRWFRCRELVLAISGVLGSANAQAITVTQATDQHISGLCSLREAIESGTNWATPPDTGCEPGTPGYSPIFVPFERIELTQGSLDIAGTITVTGTASAGRTVLTRAAGAANFPIIHRTALNSSNTMGLTHVEITGGAAGAAGGGGILAEGEVSLVESVVSGNSATGDGGGINSNDNVFLDRSTVSGNASGGRGGGIMSTNTIALTDSTLSDNDAQALGGGAYAGFVFSAVNSTVTGNETHNMANGGGNGGGVAIAAYAIAQIYNSTVTRNAAYGPSSGGGIYIGPGEPIFGYPRITVVSSLLTGNTAAKYAENVGSASALTIAGSRDVIGAVASSITVPADALDCDADMQMLADNGGPTETIAIGPESCAIDQGIDNDLESDQRGFARVVGLRADIGAYELGSDSIFRDGFDS